MKLHVNKESDALYRRLKIRVVGVGGTGSNAVNRMIESGDGILRGVKFIAINTDGQYLRLSQVPHYIQIGRDLTKGLGAGANPEISAEAIEENRDEVAEVLAGSEMVFVIAGIGGSTSAVSTVAEIARDAGAFTVGIVSLSFRMEGMHDAQSDIESLKRASDTVIIIPKIQDLQNQWFLDDHRFFQATRQGIAEILKIKGYNDLDTQNRRLTETEIALMKALHYDVYKVMKAGRDALIEAEHHTIRAAVTAAKKAFLSSKQMAAMPTSSYPENYMAVLKALYDDNKAGEALRRFNLFAFIIHDPETHPDFDSKLSSLFERLDHDTGDKLLFFALVNPPEKWLKTAENRDYYKLLNTLNAIDSTDSSITALSLAKSFGISHDKLPCLVITPNLHSKQFRWFRTCSDHIRAQLAELKYIAETEKEIHTESLQKEEIDLCGGSGTESLENSIAEALRDVLLLINAANNPDPSVKQQALEQVQDTLYDLDAKLKELKNKSDQSDTEKFDELCWAIASYLAHINTQTRDLNLDDFIVIDKKFLENDSYQKLKVAQAVLDLLEQPDQAIDLGNIDYTPGVICLAKAFEREANLSVVHWIRQLGGIDLPQYFDRYQPDQQAKFDNVNFNKAAGDSWEPPMMGQSERVLKSMAPNMPDGWNCKKWETLLANWTKIRTERNKAAHEPSIDKDSIDDVKKALGELAKDDIFNELHLMKEQYKGHVSIPDAKLRTVLEKILNNGVGMPIIPADMKGLTRLPASNNDISDLTGLEFAVNLKRLSLDDNKISDLSPLSKLTNLKNLVLDNNAIEDIRPLSKLTNLISLSLNNNSISDLSPLLGLTKLKELTLNENPLNDISIEKYISELQTR